MQLNKRQTLARKRVFKLHMAIQEAIDKICEEENFEITYAEINASLIEVIKSNNGYELKSLWEDKEEDN